MFDDDQNKFSYTSGFIFILSKLIKISPLPTKFIDSDVKFSATFATVNDHLAANVHSSILLRKCRDTKEARFPLRGK